MYFDLEKAQLIPIPDEIKAIPSANYDFTSDIDMTMTHRVEQPYETLHMPTDPDDMEASHLVYHDDPFGRDLMDAKQSKGSSKNKKDKKLSPYRTVPFIVYILLSIVVLFCFLIKVDNATVTLIYCLIQALYVIGIGCVVYWLCVNGSVMWAWITAIISLIIQALWVTMVVIY
jgi:hypothetical protein